MLSAKRGPSLVVRITIALPSLAPDLSALIKFANWVPSTRRYRAIHDFLDPLEDIRLFLRQVFRFSDLRLEVAELQRQALTEADSPQAPQPYGLVTAT